MTLNSLLQKDYTHFIKILHLLPVGKPGFLILARLNDKHFIICKHLSETICKNFPDLNVQLVNPEFFFITLNLEILITASIFTYFQLQKRNNVNTQRNPTPLIFSQWSFT